MWPLLTGGRYSEVTFDTKIEIGTPKLGSFLAGGRYSELVVNLGLTLFKSMGYSEEESKSLRTYSGPRYRYLQLPCSMWF